MVFCSLQWTRVARVSTGSLLVTATKQQKEVLPLGVNATFNKNKTTWQQSQYRQYDELSSQDTRHQSY